MVDFMKWALTDGQKFAMDLGYAPLPKEVVDLELKALAEDQAVTDGIPTASAPVPTRCSSAPGRVVFALLLIAHRGRDRRRALPPVASCRSREFGWQFWQTDTWDPVAGEFGARPFIWGTLYSSILALLISTPIALGIAIFISELCADTAATTAGLPHRAARGDPVDRLRPLGHLRAGAVRPAARGRRRPTGCAAFRSSAGPPLGVGMLSAALILAIMVIPFSSSVAREVLRAVPQAQREGAYALGATRWEAIRMALFYARTGIVGAVMLGFGRALGETMAVTMVIGNNPQISWSLYAPQYTMAAVLANEFTEAADDLYLHALIEIGLVLFIITLIINVISRMFIWSMARQRTARVAPAPAPASRRPRDARSVPQPLSHVIVGLCGAGGPARAGAAGVRPVLRRHPGHHVAQPGRSSPRCRSRSGRPAAAWRTPSSDR